MDDGGSISTKRKSKAEGEGSKENKRNVFMGEEILDCSVCFVPLQPEIFQCSCGHFICNKCHRKSPEEMCKACSGPFSQRAYGMERVLANIVVSCKYGCGKMADNWSENEEHEMNCLMGPADCPHEDCGYEGPKAELLDHVSTVHKWPTTSFRYGVQFELTTVPGCHLLRAEDDDDVHNFVLSVWDSNKGQHSVFVDPVGICNADYDFGCSVSVTWADRYGRKQNRSGSCDDICNILDPEYRLCICPARSDLVLKTILSKKPTARVDVHSEENPVV